MIPGPRRWRNLESYDGLLASATCPRFGTNRNLFQAELDRFDAPNLRGQGGRSKANRKRAVQSLASNLNVD
jgi:hypothetical protein